MAPVRGIPQSMLAVLLGVFAALCWALHDVTARALAARLGAFRLAALVMIAGAILLVGFVLWNGTLWRAGWIGVADGLLLGIAYGMGAGGLFKAFSLGPVSLVGPISAGYPLLVIVWGVINGLSPTTLQWSAVAAALVGTVLVARGSKVDGGHHAVAPGDLPWVLFFCVVAALGYSASVVLGQNAALTVGEIEAAWLSRGTALLTLIPFVLTERRGETPSGTAWAGILAMGALDVMAVVAINASGHLPGKEFTAVGISMYGALGALVAVGFLGEKVSRIQWAGILLIVAGVATLSLSQ
jgi:drug/metabolite transporter (DMT)-like permease